jgi:hypothetical protein
MMWINPLLGLSSLATPFARVHPRAAKLRVALLPFAAKARRGMSHQKFLASDELLKNNAFRSFMQITVLFAALAAGRIHTKVAGSCFSLLHTRVNKPAFEEKQMSLVTGKCQPAAFPPPSDSPLFFHKKVF